MADRHHGYDVSVGYTAHFFPELAPDWLDFCFRTQGFEAQRAGQSYRYLDLGSGQGFHLCLLAAANPEAEFIGVDFQDDHITHARDLAAAGGLTNVRFIQADFADLAAEWPPELATFDYIAVHGILSWISCEIRNAVFQCVGHASNPGTLSAFGYNAQPGQLSIAPFQHVANEFRKRTDVNAALQGALGMFQRLKQMKSPSLEQLPRLKAHLDWLAAQPTSYLAHEYLTDHWTPLWHSSVARNLEDVGLAYVGTATMAEALLPDALHPNLRAIIAEQPDEALREDVQDIVISQMFRRDIFCRDPRRADARNANADVPLYLFSPPPEGHPLRIVTKFGDLVIDYAAVGDIVSSLARGPKSFAELTALKNPARPDARSVLLSMLHARILMVGKPTPGSTESVQRFNAALARAAAGGKSYEHVAAAALGSGVAVSELELLFLDTWFSAGGKVDQAALIQGVAQRLRRLGKPLNLAGRVIPDEQLESQIAPLGAQFLEQVVPAGRKLGVLK